MLLATAAAIFVRSYVRTERMFISCQASAVDSVPGKRRTRRRTRADRRTTPARLDAAQGWASSALQRLTGGAGRPGLSRLCPLQR